MGLGGERSSQNGAQPIIVDTGGSLTYLWITAFRKSRSHKPGRFKLGFPTHPNGLTNLCRTSPAPHEHLVKVGKTDLKPRRPAVIALACAFSYFHLS